MVPAGAVVFSCTFGLVVNSGLVEPGLAGDTSTVSVGGSAARVIVTGVGLRRLPVLRGDGEADLVRADVQRQGERVAAEAAGGGGQRRVVVGDARRQMRRGHVVGDVQLVAGGRGVEVGRQRTLGAFRSESVALLDAARVIVTV